MKILTGAAVLPLLLAALGLMAPSSASADAKQFTTLRCNKCHEIASQKIAKDTSKDDEEEDEEEEDADPPDLSDAGKHHDAAFLQTFLKKESKHVPHDDFKSKKKHPKKFKGSDEELTKMVDWLLTLK